MTFKIHPAIGIARVGNSPNSFYLSPEEAGQLPIDCDADGNALLNSDGMEQSITNFKDGQGRVRRQAARFRVYAYDDDGHNGKEVEIGQTISIVNPKTGQLMTGEVADIEWTVYLANKKACWYAFKETDGEHGYAPDHPLRNADITGDDARQQLIIDPGPQTVSYNDKKQRTAQFDNSGNPGYTQSFPPPLTPNSIDTLGELKVTLQNKHNRLLVLGGFGNSGSMLTGFGQPVITEYANNDGWFDDISDGPVMARIKYKVLAEDGRPRDPATKEFMYANVETNAWILVGYPRYVPQILDIITMDELVYDVAVREFGYDTYLYGVAPFNGAQPPPDPTNADALALWRQQAEWNNDYYPYFWRDIWPLLRRPFQFQYVMDFDAMTGGDPHETGAGLGGNFDPNLISVPPYEGEDPELRTKRRVWRMHIWSVLRKPGQENQWQLTPDPLNPQFKPVGMPYLCGDNPLSNTAASKFLCLTDTQLFLLRQWTLGKFINEQSEDIQTTPPETASRTGTDLDRGVLSNLLGGAFCPGGETSWIMRNPAIYSEPYRINLSSAFHLTELSASSPRQPLNPGLQPLSQTGDLATGLEPGDITKYSACPWQADFNECTTNETDITYEDWNELYLNTTGDPAQDVQQLTYWWPAHRPVTVNNIPWTNVPQTDQGDLMMVTAWSEQSFVLNQGTAENPNFNMVEPDKP
ncbi:MAG: LodA/GoxA family CTQ-dependent oxidase [Acidobacteria bacterium]|nr:LodA/GoxA family CTQ-dependent oxidase [Acidobacteriota bacterium]